jgi:hypothetical protein
MPTPETIIPYGFCHCGCGYQTKIANKTYTAIGWVKGQPTKYIHGHNPQFKHGHARRRFPLSPTYRSWESMMKRCFSFSAQHSGNYQKKGITVCERWRTFANFLSDMGERPKRKTLDRFPNNDGNYEPGNCRWASARQQANNKSNNVVLEWRGVLYTRTTLSRKCGISAITLRNRIASGWTVDRAASTPPREQRRA